MAEKTKDSPTEWAWWKRQAEHEAQLMGRLWSEEEARKLFTRGLTPRAAAPLMPRENDQP